jgi:hypothetical protein
MDIMIDIESLNTTPDCVILTIGAVLFDPRGQGIISKIEIRPTIEDQTEIYNRSINDATLEWWGKQSPEAIEEAMGDQGRVSFSDAMKQLYDFCWNHGKPWSHGAPFDIVVMEHAWRQLGLRSPWSYGDVRDTRTLFDITGVSLRDKKYKTSTTHKAVEDAEHQAIVVQDAYMKLMKAGLVQPR